MEQKYKYCIILVTVFVLFALPSVLANPQILTYHSGYWYNDKNEEINTAIIEEYNQISYPDPWVIEVTKPQLQYHYAEQKYNNGENITIVQGEVTINLTASTTVTLTVSP